MSKHNGTDYSEYKYYTTYVDPNFEKRSGGGGGGGGCLAVILIVFAVGTVMTLLGNALGDSDMGYAIVMMAIGIIGFYRLFSKSSSSASSPSTAASDPVLKAHYICRKCKKLSTGWYQHCPNCGEDGQMEDIRKAGLSEDEIKQILSSSEIASSSLRTPDNSSDKENPNATIVEKPSQKELSKNNNEQIRTKRTSRYNYVCHNCNHEFMAKPVSCPFCGADEKDIQRL